MSSFGGVTRVSKARLDVVNHMERVISEVLFAYCFLLGCLVDVIVRMHEVAILFIYFS